MPNLYQFPSCIKAEKASTSAQIVKLLEEVVEVADAYEHDCFDYQRILEETWDVIHTAEGILRKHAILQVEAARKAVEEKNRARGYYD